MDIRQFTDLLQRHAGLIHKVAYSYCRDATDRDDVVQEIALQLWRSRRRYDPRFKETTWIYRIAINVAVSYHRRERRHRERRATMEGPAIDLAAPATLPNPDVEVLMRCIDELADLEKALVLLYLDGIDHASIAEVLGISASNVGTKLHRIKNQLGVAIERRLTPPKSEAPHES